MLFPFVHCVLFITVYYVFILFVYCVLQEIVAQLLKIMDDILPSTVKYNRPKVKPLLCDG